MGWGGGGQIGRGFRGDYMVFRGNGRGINTRQKRMKGALQDTQWRDHKNVTEPHRGG